MEKRLQEPPFGLRLPAALKRMVKSKAKEGSRSMNMEIIHQLRLAYERQEAQNAA